MPGVFITRGSSLRIPAGGLVLTLGGEAPPPVRIELLLDMWDRWLEISAKQTSKAEAAHSQLLSSLSSPDNGRGAALEDEFSAALLAIASSAFAIDAFYSAVKERIPPHPHAAAWAKNRTAREKRIVEVFKYAFALKPDHPKQIASFLKGLFTLRDQAVHPPSKYLPPSYHRDLDAGVEWRFVQFSAEHARAAFTSTGTLLGRLLEIPKPGLEELTQWVPSALGLLDKALEDSSASS
jgi:hypothetical protein